MAFCVHFSINQEEVRDTPGCLHLSGPRVATVSPVGSGLILLLIVGMWLAVLVPMWLKSYDSGANLSSVDRFSDAMRVLSRRHVAMGDRRTLLMPPRPRAVLSSGPGPQVPAATERAARIEAALARTVPSGAAPGLRSPATPSLPAAARLPEPAHPMPPALPVTSASLPGHRTAADRRLRTLLLLLGAAGLTLLLALVGPGALVLAHLLVDGLLVGFVVRCRRLAVQRAVDAATVAPSRRLAHVDRPVARSVAPRTSIRSAPPVPVTGRVAGIPDRMPSRPAALTSFIPAQSARRADAIAARPAAPAARDSAASVHGEPWSPVPVPVPIYVTMPSAPASVVVPAARVVDLTHPGKWSDTLSRADDGLQSFADDSQLDELIGRRRAAGDW